MAFFKKFSFFASSFLFLHGVKRILQLFPFISFFFFVID